MQKQCVKKLHSPLLIFKCEMLYVQVVALVQLAVLYSFYLLKMIVQMKKGINTDVLGCGKKSTKERAIEISLKVMSYLTVVIEILSVVCTNPSSQLLAWLGMAITLAGVSLFICAAVTMQDSWRAGISHKEKTALITEGIYGISRNPAFCGLDLTYIGTLLAFPSIPHFMLVVVTITVFHFQILQEEEYLSSRSDINYFSYKRRVRRYI